MVLPWRKACRTEGGCQGWRWQNERLPPTALSVAPIQEPLGAHVLSALRQTTPGTQSASEAQTVRHDGLVELHMYGEHVEGA